MLDFSVAEMSPSCVIVKMECGDQTLRPGGTVAGPVMMGLADVAFYAIVMANIGNVALAVTTNLSINFSSKTSARMLVLPRPYVEVGQAFGGL